MVMVWCVRGLKALEVETDNGCDATTFFFFFFFLPSGSSLELRACYRVFLTRVANS